MPKRIIKIHFQNGLNLETFTREVFDIDNLREIYEFRESENPDYIVFGPYGKDVPSVGNYTRIGYFCENILPDFSCCEWAFGILSEKEVKRQNYKRIQWHNQYPQSLVKKPGYDAEKIFASKTKFCNFLYTNRIPYREEFFRQLSKYKRVDAPGKSMNNMGSIDGLYQGDVWERKKQFLEPYKFTIAFENYVSPGYQTEKLYDAMQMNSVPIYCGDAFVGEIFNTRSFVNTPDYMKLNNSGWVKRLEKYGQLNFMDILPQYYTGLPLRIQRKLKAMARQTKMKSQFRGYNFKPLIDRIVELDENDDKYLEVLREPWFKNNLPPINASMKDRWMQIFNHP